MLLKLLKLIVKFKKYCLNINNSEKELLSLNKNMKEKINDRIWIDIKQLQNTKKTNILSK